jgi:hypothetical protein
MDAIAKLYSEHARPATSASWRTVYMLGLMCAAAVDHGAFVAFVGKGRGADWPDPRYLNNRHNQGSFPT